MKKIITIIIGSFLLMSCVAQNRLSETNVNYRMSTPIDINVPDNHIPRVVFTESPLISLRDSGIIDIDTLTEDQFNVLNNSDSVYIKESLFVNIEGDGVSATVLIQGSEAMVLMSMDDVLKVNQTYRLVDLLEEVIEKYNVENEFNFSIISSLNQEITMLSQRVEILNNSVANKDVIIFNLEKTIEELRKANNKYGELNQTLEEEVEFQKSEVKRFKEQRNWVAGGSLATIIVIILLVL